MSKEKSVAHARTLIAGGFADFIIYLTALADPFVVGGTYPRNRLIEAFNKWAQSRNFETGDANISLWRETCNHGFMGKVN